ARGVQRRQRTGWDEGWHSVLLRPQCDTVMRSTAGMRYSSNERARKDSTSQRPPSAHLFGDALSRGTLGRKAWMNHGAVAGERCRLHDLVVPFDRKRFRVPIVQNFEEGEKILGVEARSGGGDAAWHVAMADDLDAARFHNFARLGELAIAPALDCEIDDHRARPHRGDHLLGDEPRRRPA